MLAIGYIVSSLLAIFITTILSGYTLCKLWDWFVVETFNLPTLTIPIAIGLMLVISYVVKGYPEEDDKDQTYGVNLTVRFFKCVVKSGMFLLVGWIITKLS